jgi:hypothetical protein
MAGTSLLDPKLDFVFKCLFAEAPDLLADLINAVRSVYYLARNLARQLQALSGDDLVRYQAFVRERALHDEVTEKAQARAEGKAEGKIEGKIEGCADMLHHLLQAKFGQLPAAIERRLQTANEAELITWVERVLFAERLEQVFED